MSFVTLLVSITYTLYCKKYFKECKFRNDIDKQLLHKMLSFAGWSFLGNIGYSLKMQGINILINLFFGPAVNAARGVAYQVNAGIYNFVSNFQIAMKPQITKRYAMGDTNSMMVLVHNSSRYSFFLLLYLTLPVLIKTPYILHLWLGIVPEYTVMFLRLVLIVTLINSITGPVATAIQAKGKIKLFQTIILVITLLDIPISYIVLKSGYPPYTVMYISILTELIALIARIWILNALIPMHISNFIIEVIGRSLLVFILAAIIPTGLSQYIPDTFTGFILICIITVSSTTIVLLTVGLKTAERSLIYKKQFVPFKLQNHNNVFKGLILRKKSTGLNSIEELAYSLASRISGLKVITLPEHGNTWKGIIRNIRFAQKHQGDINHIFHLR